MSFLQAVHGPVLTAKRTLTKTKHPDIQKKHRTRQSKITLRLRCALQSPPSRRQAMRPIVNMAKEDRSTGIGNMHKNGNGLACGSGDILADRETDRHMHASQYFATAPAGEVTERHSIDCVSPTRHGTVPLPANSRCVRVSEL